MNNELIKLITIIAIPTVTIVASNMALFMNLSKKIDNLIDRISKLEAKFDLIDERYKSTNEKVNVNTKKIIQIETEQKNTIKELFQSIIDAINKRPIL